ncbi:uncharacterized protein K452DRAFT_339469 [Aplosporella prunicola CBS 121167]|uniref:RING-type domain-containing protein n=1 Tax=Aplosporella prunicola CBS 121167 TaxID=1176127 RepID=A0A6A6B380_9PEZI|nr:uncharacterized protein K452DRAFT_339469 [Aplosporella prunicola CBS 121167]KAF2137833.1 hypothetical protein K452DRAFT_339469 [Aplosporella prunicola CBS 121167]
MDFERIPRYPRIFMHPAGRSRNLAYMMILYMLPVRYIPYVGDIIQLMERTRSGPLTEVPPSYPDEITMPSYISGERQLPTRGRQLPQTALQFTETDLDRAATNEAIDRILQPITESHATTMAARIIDRLEYLIENHLEIYGVPTSFTAGRKIIACFLILFGLERAFRDPIGESLLSIWIYIPLARAIHLGRRYGIIIEEEIEAPPRRPEAEVEAEEAAPSQTHRSHARSISNIATAAEPQPRRRRRVITDEEMETFFDADDPLATGYDITRRHLDSDEDDIIIEVSEDSADDEEEESSSDSDSEEEEEVAYGYYDEDIDLDDESDDDIRDMWGEWELEVQEREDEDAPPLPPLDVGKWLVDEDGDSDVDMGDAEEQICAICQEVPTGGVVVTDCGHLFCREELQRWVDGSRSCPACRGVLE